MRKTFYSTAIALVVILSNFAGTSQAEIVSFDLVDDFLKVDGNYTGPGDYDIFTNDGMGGFVGQDGVNDISVSVTTTGLTSDDGNNVAWTATTDTTNTGLRSTIDPSFVVSGEGVTTNNSGYRVSQTIQIDFDGLVVEASDITDFGWSSGNTAGVGWETSTLEYLDESGNPFSPPPVLPLYVDNTSPINGQSGIGSFLADSTGTVTGVGTDLSASGTSGSNNNLSTTPEGLGIAPGTRIGGVRFTQTLEDVRGVSNGDTSFTATINDLDLVDFTVAVPEPSSSTLLFGISVLGLMRRSRSRIS